MFSDSTQREVGLGLRDLRVADLNGDGNLDAIVQHQLDMSVLLGRGDGTFGPDQRCCNVQQAIASLDVGDFDSDGIPDIVTVLTDYSYLVFFWGHGDGTFEPDPFYYRTLASPSGFRFADLDGDGRTDLVYTTDFEHSLTVIWGDGTRTPNQTTTIPLPIVPYMVAAGDVNGDSHMDLVATNPVDSCVYVAPGLGNRQFGPAKVGMCVSAGGAYIWAFSLGDLNNDQYADVVMAMNVALAGVAGVGLGRLDGTFEPHVATFPGSSPGKPWIGDLDGDGNSDVLIPNTFLNGKVTVLLGNGDGTFRYLENLPSGASLAFAVAAGDFNNDGSPDVLVLNGYSNAVLYLNHQQHVTGSAQFRPPAVPIGPVQIWADVTLPSASARRWDPGNVHLTQNGKVLGWAKAASFDSTAGVSSFQFDRTVLAALDAGEQELTVVGCDSTGLVFHASATLRILKSASRVLWQASLPGRLPITIQTSGLVRSTVTYRVFDIQGRFVRSESVTVTPSGTITWDGRSSGGQPIPSGVYLFQLDGTAPGCKIIVLR